ncbi:hypothetical protein niasHT_013404 [Heterodera trifolii]|uniref:Uncharacterized protein n=1 Tax=Heterodera trifolii TaxID=157864 RepID=A0ABD2LD60_9BILA
MIGEVFRWAKLNSVTENELKELFAKHGKALDKNANANQILFDPMRLPFYCRFHGSKDWWEIYWQVIEDILSIWTEMPEIVFLSVNMLSIDPEKRMSAQGAVDYLEGKCKPKELEKNAEKIALFGDVSAEKLREMMEMEGFKSFLGFKENEIKEETKEKGEKEDKGETKEKVEKKEKGKKEEKGETKKEKRENEEKKEKRETKEEKREKKRKNAEKKLKFIIENLLNVEKSLQRFLKKLEKRKEFCDQ